jgi:peptide/nickel transport system permease protein
MRTRVAVLIVALVAVGLVAPWLAPYDPEQHHRDFPFAPPMRPHIVHAGAVHLPFVYPVALSDRLRLRYSEDRSRTQALPWFQDDSAGPVFLLGTDSFGRDQLSRLLHGARISLALALASGLGALLVGAIVGGAAAYRGGWIDDVTMRVADFVVTMPLIYVVLLLRGVMPLVLPASTVFVLMAAIFTLVGWPFIARGIRGIIAVEREREYVAAARSLGANHWRIVTRHLLPACAGHLVVQATMLLPAFILAEATLSFAGLGFAQNVPAWGSMLHEAASVTAMTRFPWTLAPAVAIFGLLLAANLALSDADEPRAM